MYPNVLLGLCGEYLGPGTGLVVGPLLGCMVIGRGPELGDFGKK